MNRKYNKKIFNGYPNIYDFNLISEDHSVRTMGIVPISGYYGPDLMESNARLGSSQTFHWRSRFLCG